MRASQTRKSTEGRKYSARCCNPLEPTTLNRGPRVTVMRSFSGVCGPGFSQVFPRSSFACCGEALMPRAPFSPRAMLSSDRPSTRNTQSRASIRSATR